MVSYNIDKFKDFVFNSSFLKRYDIEDDTLKKIKPDAEILFIGAKDKMEMQKV